MHGSRTALKNERQALRALLVTGFPLCKRRPTDLFDLTVMAVVALAALFHAITSGNDNSRYAVPFLPLVFYSVTLWGWGVCRRVRLAHPTPTPEVLLAAYAQPRALRRITAPDRARQELDAARSLSAHRNGRSVR